LSAENPLFKTIFKAASNAFKKLHEKGNYEPKDLLEIPEFKVLHENTNALFSSTIQFEVSNTLKAYLEKDAFVFSGLRTHAQLADARSYLKDEKGNIRSFNDFSQKVSKLNAQYNQNYLQAEYNFAIQSGLSAEKWETFSDDEKRYYLQYRTAKDGKVRDSHAALDETTLPKNDPFWSSYMPPNGWNCRCNTVEVLASDYSKSDSSKSITAGEKATTQIGKNGKNKAEIFRFNPGADKRIFPPKNAYTPKHCKGGKVDMSGLIGVASIVLSLEDEKCETKKMLEQELKKQNQAKAKLKDTEVKEWAQENIPEGGLNFNLENFQTKKVTITRKSIKDIVSHFASAEHKEVAKHFIKELKKCKFIESAPLNNDGNNYEKKKREGITQYHYYSFEWNKTLYRLNCKELNAAFEKPYSINII
jgi:SPP1 gp7 family putative phage head morphogenesis protein